VGKKGVYSILGKDLVRFSVSSQKTFDGMPLTALTYNSYLMPVASIRAQVPKNTEGMIHYCVIVYVSYLIGNDKYIITSQYHVHK